MYFWIALPDDTFGWPLCGKILEELRLQLTKMRVKRCQKEFKQAKLQLRRGKIGSQKIDTTMAITEQLDCIA